MKTTMRPIDPQGVTLQEQVNQSIEWLKAAQVKWSNNDQTDKVIVDDRLVGARVALEQLKEVLPVPSELVE